MPPSRRSGSPECKKYFQSNRKQVGAGLYNPTNKMLHAQLASCTDLSSLAHVMNGGTDRQHRYSKLNLQNLVSGRQPTLEFRQHSATKDYAKIAAWVRFCIALVRNSAKLAAPSPLKPSRTTEEAFTALFCYVIKDRALRDCYHKRRAELRRSNSNEYCCSG